MTGFLYFVETDKTSLSDADIRDAGLGHLLPADLNQRAVIGAGPGGAPGVVFAAGSADGLGVFPGQTWQQVAESRVWVGYAGDAPTADALARADMRPGHVVTMGDGAEWVIPLARGISTNEADMGGWYVALPQKRMMAADGKWTHSGVVPKYAKLWKIACDWFAVRSGNAKGEVIDFDFDGATTAAVEVLGVNYRVGPIEASILGLLTDETVRDILDAACDWPTLMEWAEKKTASGG